MWQDQCIGQAVRDTVTAAQLVRNRMDAAHIYLVDRHSAVIGRQCHALTGLEVATVPEGGRQVLEYQLHRSAIYNGGKSTTEPLRQQSRSGNHALLQRSGVLDHRPPGTLRAGSRRGGNGVDRQRVVLDLALTLTPPARILIGGGSRCNDLGTVHG